MFVNYTGGIIILISFPLRAEGWGVPAFDLEIRFYSVIS